MPRKTSIRVRCPKGCGAIVAEPWLQLHMGKCGQARDFNYAPQKSGQRGRITCSGCGRSIAAVHVGMHNRACKDPNSLLNRWRTNQPCKRGCGQTPDDRAMEAWRQHEYNCKGPGQPSRRCVSRAAEPKEPKTLRPGTISLKDHP